MNKILHKSRGLSTLSKDKFSIFYFINIVYHIICGNLPKNYVAKNSRPLKKRDGEHVNDVQTNTESPALARHANECKPKIDFENVKIRDTEQ